MSEKRKNISKSSTCRWIRTIDVNVSHHDEAFFLFPPPYIHLWGNGYKLLLPGWPNSSLSGQPWLSQGKLRKSGSFQFRWLLSAVHSRRQTQGLSWSYVRQTVPGSLVHTLQTLALKKRVFCMYRAKLSENTSYVVSRVCRLLHPLPHVHACAHTDTHTHTSLYTCRESPTQVSSVRVQSTDYTRGAQQETRWEVCVSVCVCVRRGECCQRAEESFTTQHTHSVCSVW